MSTLQTTLRAQKRVLRKAVHTTFRAVPASSIEEQSRAVAAHIVSSSFFTRSKILSCYLSMPTGELSTNPLVSSILQSDKTLFVPKIESTDGKMDFVKLYGEEDLSSLPTGTWGIKEPAREWKGTERLSVMNSSCPPLDLILLPGVAFDLDLSRLGHGKGFYDRFIQSYVSSGRQRPVLVGLALREQLLEAGRIPTEETDWKMDFVVTPDGIFSDLERN
ncbi:hypothetical protein AX15_000433 [Amanita polypyramis BW_CC]|nr:hypothetical protein AX15_000433 [Amanita polypyramis BW_CC]